MLIKFTLWCDMPYFATSVPYLSEQCFTSFASTAPKTISLTCQNMREDLIWSVLLLTSSQPCMRWDQPAPSPSWCLQKPSWFQECISWGSAGTRTSACRTTRWPRSCWPLSMQSHRRCQKCGQWGPKVEDLVWLGRLARWCGTEHTLPWKALRLSCCHLQAPQHRVLAQAWRKHKTLGNVTDLASNLCPVALQLEQCKYLIARCRQEGPNSYCFHLLFISHVSWQSCFLMCSCQTCSNGILSLSILHSFCLEHHKSLSRCVWRIGCNAAALEFEFLSRQPSRPYFNFRLLTSIGSTDFRCVQTCMPSQFHVCIFCKRNSSTTQFDIV